VTFTGLWAPRMQSGIAFLFVKEQQFHARYGPPRLAKLPTFYNPNKDNRVVYRMHNQISHCHLLGIYTCHLTCRSFLRLAPHSCPKAQCFSYCSTHIKAYGHRFVGVINLGVVNEISMLVKFWTSAIAPEGGRWG
jgi:hypothetical protein